MQWCRWAGGWRSHLPGQSPEPDVEDSFDFLFKIILVGDSDVGKTCVVQSFKSGLFIEKQQNTIGVDFTVRTLEIDGKKVKERLLKERKEQQEREREQKKIVVDEKVQDWLKMKREQERHEQTVKHSREEKEMQRQQEKQREAELKAQQKFKDWLQKKDQEKAEKEKREKEEAALKEQQEKQRHRRAEETFKEWLEKTNEKRRTSPRSTCNTTSPYDRSYPSPSFYNPIPWKPIHVPPPEASLNKTSGKKPQKQRKSQPSPAFRPRKTVSATHSLPRR